MRFFGLYLMEYLVSQFLIEKLLNVYFNNDTKLTKMIFSERAEKEYLDLGFHQRSSHY